MELIPEPLLKAIGLVLVAVFGGSVGATDIIRRYRDAPQRALMSKPAWVYIATNAGAAIVALVLIWTFNWTFEQESDQAIFVTQILAAGFSAMILFRTAVFTVRQGGQELQIGPANVLQTILNATDRAVDRVRAEERANRISALMSEVSFDKASLELPVIALALMQNMSVDEQTLLRDQVEALKLVPDMSNDGRCLALGLLLVTFVGDEVLDAAVLALSSAINERGLNVIDSIEPPIFDVATLSGDVATIVVTGRAFLPDSKVRLNGRDVPTTFVDETQLSAQIPVADLIAAGQRRISVYTPVVGESREQVLRVTGVNPAPTLRTIDPSSLDLGTLAIDDGVTLVITGEDFSSDSRVKLNEREQPTTFVDTRQLTAEVAGTELAQTGEYAVTVFTPEPGGGPSLPMTLTVVGPSEPVTPPEPVAPVIETVDPSSVELATVLANGGINLIVTGQNFVNESKVRLDGLELTTIFGGASQLTAQVADATTLPPGNHQVTVFTPSGGESSGKTLQVV